MGLDKLTYLGPYKGKWKGPVTQSEYEIQHTGQVITVDSRDVDCMLDWKDVNGNPYFGRES